MVIFFLFVENGHRQKIYQNLQLILSSSSHVDPFIIPLANIVKVENNPLADMANEHFNFGIVQK